MTATRRSKACLKQINTMLQLFVMLIRALKGKAISALIPSEQRQANLLDGEPFDVGEVQVPRAPKR